MTKVIKIEFKTIVMNRYATKKFDGKKISQELFDELFDMIRYAPSSSNIQPWKVLVVMSDKTKEKLLPASYNQAQITTCSHLLVFLADTDLEKHADKLIRMVPQASEYYTGLKKGFQAMTAEQRLAWSQRQVYLALGNALNGAKSLGFDSCPMEGFDPSEYSKILELPKNLVPTVLCPIGYAADAPREKMRFAKEEIIMNN
jgi:nitroreductase / dihydropteridine reductase